MQKLQCELCGSVDILRTDDGFFSVPTLWVQIHPRAGKGAARYGGNHHRHGGAGTPS